MTDLPHVIWLRTFEAAARHNSFAAAAAELGLTPAAISQHIRLLEKHLNAQLFERLARGVVLTDIGRAYSASVQRSFDELALTTNGLFGENRRRVVKLRVSISCAALVLAPFLHVFQQEHPDILIQVSTAVWADRFDDETLDVDIRYGLGNWTESQIVHLGHESAVPVCSPAYAKQFGKHPKLADLARGKIVQIMGSETDWGRLSDHYELGLNIAPDWIKVDSSLIALQTVAAGQGITMVLESFARQYLDQGLLVLPTTYKLPKRKSHFLIVNGHAGQRDEVRQFCTWMTAHYHSLLQAPVA